MKSILSMWLIGITPVYLLVFMVCSCGPKPKQQRKPPAELAQPSEAPTPPPKDDLPAPPGRVPFLDDLPSPPPVRQPPVRTGQLRPAPAGCVESDPESDRRMKKRWEAEDARSTASLYGKTIRASSKSSDGYEGGQ